MNELIPNRESAELTSAKPGREPQAKNRLAQTPPSASPSAPPQQLALRFVRAKAEIYAICQALEQTGWNRRRAADLLSISYRGLLYKIRQYDISTSTTASQLAGLESVNFK
jgi:DNA-binding NtrC family response regulator